MSKFKTRLSQVRVFLACEMLIVASLACGGGGGGGNGSSSSTPTPPVGQATSITQHGITWTFDKTYPIGQFVTGDYWVVGPIRIIDITPKSIVRPEDGRTINGSMLNPTVALEQGYDSLLFGYNSEGSCYYSAALNVGRPNNADISASNPLNITTGSLISGISYPDLPTQGTWSVTTRRVRVMAVLTVLGAIPPADAFRPAYVGKDKHIRHTLSEVKADLLPSLAPPPGTLPKMSEQLPLFEKPWVEHLPGFQKCYLCAPENMEGYGREYARHTGIAACMLMLDIDKADKELLMIRLIQIGLDNYGMVLEPGGKTNWEADGGCMGGRVFPIIFAGYLLGDQTMLGLMQKSGQYAYQNNYYAGNVPSDYIYFGEIDQTFHITQRDVADTHDSKWHPSGSNPVPYVSTDIGLPEWGLRHVYNPYLDNASIDADYRSVNLPSWTSLVIAARILGITNYYNHPAYFDYVDRWMTTQTTNKGFEQSMWDAYRANYGPAFAPVNFTITAASSSQIDLQWQDDMRNTSVVGYRVFRSSDGGTTYSLVCDQTGKTFSDTGLKSGTPYYYRVRVYNSQGESYPAVTCATTP